MIICQSIRSVLDHRHSITANRSRPLATMTVVLLTIVLSLSMVAPTMARGGDNDDDGLANGDENKHGTSRTIPDTDGDGLLDGDEVYVTLTDPTGWDSDHDGLSDGQEVSIGTSPLRQDSDGDMLSDYVEVRVYFSHPLRWDTDNDTLSDFVEVINMGTNPNRPDTDFDGQWDAWDRYPLDPSRW